MLPDLCTAFELMEKCSGGTPLRDPGDPVVRQRDEVLASRADFLEVTQRVKNSVATDVGET